MFVIQADLFDRISYLYYMLLVLPGIYLVTVRLFSPGRVPQRPPWAGRWPWSTASSTYIRSGA